MGASTSALLTLDAMGYPGHIKAHSQSYEAVRRPEGKPYESFGGCIYYLQWFGNGTHILFESGYK